MKKDKQFFMEKLPCGISRMKRNNSVEQLRGPKEIGGIINKPVTKKRSKSSHVRYDEMIPGSPEEEPSPKSKKSNHSSYDLGLGVPSSWIKFTIKRDFSLYYHT